MEQMKTLNGYEIVDGWAREQIGYINEAKNEPTDSKYFDIDGNGVLSLKAQYGNNGSEMYNLPKRIVLPEVINGVAVKGLATEMFMGNSVVEEIVFPNTISAIPESFCNETKKLKAIKNTEHITNIGAKAFRNSRIEEALFPSLETVGAQAFVQCPYLHTADIGKVQTIPAVLFGNCQGLETVKGGENVTTIASQAFLTTYSLKNVPFLSLLKVTSFGDKAFFNSRIQFDWSKYSGKATFGINSTPIVDNTTDYWSKTIGNRYYTPCENPLGSLLHQQHPLWANEKVWRSEEYNFPYKSGCGLFCLLHIHSAFTRKKYATPFEFEAEMEGKTLADGTPLLNLFPGDFEHSKKIYTALGYSITVYEGILDESAFKDVLDSLANGAYVQISQSTSNNVDGGHATVAYGINDIGEIMVANSDGFTRFVGVYNDGFKFTLPFQNVTGPDSNIIIVKKP